MSAIVTADDKMRMLKKERDALQNLVLKALVLARLKAAVSESAHLRNKRQLIANAPKASAKKEADQAEADEATMLEEVRGDNDDDGDDGDDDGDDDAADDDEDDDDDDGDEHAAAHEDA